MSFEYNLFNEVKETIKGQVLSLKSISKILSELDAIISLAVDAEELNLVRPKLTSKHEIKIIGGRHPVVEKVSREEYVIK